MRLGKGEAGYIDQKKKKELLKVILEFGIVLALFITGYITTKTRLNLLTLVAILGCLPASKAMVGFLMLLPRKSLAKEKIDLVEKKGQHLTKLYDMVLTSYEHVMPVENIVIQGNTICGYATNEKLDFTYLEKYIRTTLKNNKLDQVSVKMFKDFPAYIARIEAMDNLAADSAAKNKKREEEIKKIILTLSM